MASLTIEFKIRREIRKSITLDPKIESESVTALANLLRSAGVKEENLDRRALNDVAWGMQSVDFLHQSSEKFKKYNTIISDPQINRSMAEFSASAGPAVAQKLLHQLQNIILDSGDLDLARRAMVIAVKVAKHGGDPVEILTGIDIYGIGVEKEKYGSIIDVLEHPALERRPATSKLITEALIAAINDPDAEVKENKWGKAVSQAIAVLTEPDKLTEEQLKIKAMIARKLRR